MVKFWRAKILIAERTLKYHGIYVGKACKILIGIGILSYGGMDMRFTLFLELE